MKSVTCIVETPRGSAGKFDYEPESGTYQLRKILPAGLVFPFDFGYIPGTVGEDGDPLDVIILSEAATFTGCSLDCRIIGGIKARQTERDDDVMRNDRYLAIPEVSVLHKNVKQHSQLPRQLVQELERFFVNYNDQAGKKFEPLAMMSSTEALKAIQQAQDDVAPGHLIQLLLPLYDKQGKPFPQSHYRAVQKKLTEKFGGVTIYQQSPAAGLWKNEAEQVVRDELLVVEVMAARPEPDFWKPYKQQLQQKFAQDELVIRRISVGLF